MRNEIEIGIEVVCVRTESNYPQLKLGKKFTITNKCRGTYNDLYKFVSDSGEKVSWIELEYFKTLSEYRSEKLENLLL